MWVVRSWPFEFGEEVNEEIRQRWSELDIDGGVAGLWVIVKVVVPSIHVWLSYLVLEAVACSLRTLVVVLVERMVEGQSMT